MRIFEARLVWTRYEFEVVRDSECVYHQRPHHLSTMVPNHCAVSLRSLRRQRHAARGTAHGDDGTADVAMSDVAGTGSGAPDVEMQDAVQLTL